jgi:hypothetical protein
LDFWVSRTAAEQGSIKQHRRVVDLPPHRLIVRHYRSGLPQARLTALAHGSGGTQFAIRISNVRTFSTHCATPPGALKSGK